MLIKKNVDHKPSFNYAFYLSIEVHTCGKVFDTFGFFAFALGKCEASSHTLSICGISRLQERECGHIV